ncbi:diheme cytochrome c [Ghiorsea bivora]|uniref:diheme cytochrome c n=1 Tax=Ghiorsea bivora TaxID=1485545 RepID=UPI00056FFD3A|nr:diheme cytochrome c [Ghiorsea bivora]
MKKHYLNCLLIGFVSLSLSSVAIADDDGDEHEGFFSRFSQSNVKVPQSKLYQSDCASCHMAYQPNLLPSASWEKVMAPKALEDHFGDNAEINEQDRLSILAYLKTYAADNKGKRLLRFNRGEAPLRVTELRYFKREHNEIPKRMVQDNPKVRSLSNCLACHTGAERGNYGERGIRISGYGYWED